jgi:hypothetical protein
MNCRQMSAQQDQVHAIAERLLYLCGNCCTTPLAGIMLNTHCSLLVIQ